MNNYTVYHLHSDLSNGVTNVDSVTKFQQYVDRAKECGMTALGFSEHGSVFSWLSKKEAIEVAGMKYIHAEEFYVCDKLYKYNSETEKRVRENYHFILIAKNWDGVRELNRLSSKAFNRGDGHFYFLPRIQVEDILNTSDNIICTSACLASPLRKADEGVRLRLLDFMSRNKHRCFLEIQHHNIEDQKQYNLQLLKLHETYGIPLVAGTDTHALNEQHAEARVLLQKAKDVYFSDEQEWDLTWKTYDELVAAYEAQNALPQEVVLEAIENTNKIAGMVEPFELDRSYKYPHLWENPEQVLRDKIVNGIKRRGIKSYPNYQEYLDRIEYEIGVYKHNGAIDFILLMEDVLGYCHASDIQIGYGRGSATGSVICWLLGITEMDSIQWRLSFERFMNLERVSLSDVDSDIPSNRRDELVDWLFHHKGLYVSDIITFNTIAVKGAVRDICRGLYKEDEKVNYLDITNEISKALDVDEAAIRKKYPQVFKYVDLINGTIVSIGTHPCGRLVVDHPFDDMVGLCSTSTDPHPISQLWMHEVDDLNYVKLDLLALDTIELITDTCKAANIPMLLPENMDIEDDAVWKSIRDDTTAIFQWESETGQSYMKRLLSDSTMEKFKRYNPDVSRMELITIGNSAIRPAGESYRDDLANGVVKQYKSEVITNFLKPTMGYLVYQCQIIDFLHLYCGFTMGQADIVRRGFAKKSGTGQYIPIIKDGGYMPNDTKHEKPINGFIKTVTEQYGISKEEAEEEIVSFLQVISDASSYLFSRNHSCAYSYEGYASGWLRYYHPLEFLTTALNINIGKEEKTQALTRYADKVGIKISPPRFRHSSSRYTFDKAENTIYKSISAIKSIGIETGDGLLALKDFQGTFPELLVVIKNEKIAKRNEIEILIKLSFFEEFGDINQLLYDYKIFQQLYGRKNLKKQKAEELKINMETAMKFCEKESPTQFSNMHTVDLMNYLHQNWNGKEAALLAKIQYERELLGNITLTDPTMDWRYALVLNVDTKYTPTVAMYCIKNGKIETMKVKRKRNGYNKTKKRWGKDDEIKTVWDDLPLQSGDLIYIDGYKQQFKQKKVGDSWVKTTEKEWICSNYRLIQRTEKEKDL